MKMKIKQKKGISLIVLVITIIVMIILAAAIILSLSSSGIIGKANEATNQSNTANKKEAASIALAEYELKKQLGELAAGETATSYVQKVLDDQGIDASDVAVDEKGNVIVGSGASAINKGVAIGAYVDYIPTAATSTTCKTYDADSESETDTYFATQTGENALRWRYMGVDENGNALLVADRATTDLLYLERAEGWLQGPNKIKTLCKELYSSEKGTARSMTVEDVNSVLEANPVGQYYSGIKNELVDNTAGLTIGEIVSQKGETALTNTTTPDGTTDTNIYVADHYSYAGTKYKANTTDEYKLIFQNSSGSNISYWLASSCVLADFINGYAYFNVHYVDGGGVDAWDLFHSDGNENYGYYVVRPVVSLNSDVHFGTLTDGVWSLN